MKNGIAKTTAAILGFLFIAGIAGLDSESILPAVTTIASAAGLFCLLIGNWDKIARMRED